MLKYRNNIHIIDFIYSIYMYVYMYISVIKLLVLGRDTWEWDCNITESFQLYCSDTSRVNNLTSNFNLGENICDAYFSKIQDTIELQLSE